MNALLNRVHVALVSLTACLTLWASANAGAANALPSTIGQIRTAQFAGVNTIEALLYRWPHDYYAVVPVQPIASTNVTISGLTPEALTNKLREVAFQMACLATNFPLANSDATNSKFLLKATAKEANIPSIFPEVDAPTTTLEMAQVNVVFPLITNGVGGFRLPADATADTIPINVAGYVFLPFPDLKYFDLPLPPWILSFMFERQTYARIFTGNPDGSVSEVPSKALGVATINDLEQDPARYGDYLHTDGFKLLRFYNSRRIGIHLSLLTNGTPAVLALEAADGTTPKYWLPTGQPIDRPVLTSITLANGAPKVGLVRIPSRRVVVESAVSLGSTAVWTVETTLSLPDQHGMTNYAGPASLGPSMGLLRFLRLREE